MSHPPFLLASSLRLPHVMLGLTKASCCGWLVFGFLVGLVCVVLFLVLFGCLFGFVLSPQGLSLFLAFAQKL